MHDNETVTTGLLDTPLTCRRFAVKALGAQNNNNNNETICLYTYPFIIGQSASQAVRQSGSQAVRQSGSQSANPYAIYHIVYRSNQGVVRRS